MKKIITPATSANLCCGFDTFGLAVSLYNTFYVEKSDSDFFFNDKKEDINNTNNLILNAAKAGFEYLKKDALPLNIKVESDIPSTRGLGSSATCIVAGIISAFLAYDMEF